LRNLDVEDLDLFRLLEDCEGTRDVVIAAKNLTSLIASGTTKESLCDDRNGVPLKLIDVEPSL
jgi:hypothetical protein